MLTADLPTPTQLTREDFIRVTSLCEKLTATLLQETKERAKLKAALRDLAPEHPLVCTQKKAVHFK